MKRVITVLFAMSSLLLASDFVIGEQSQPSADPFCGS